MLKQSSNIFLIFILFIIILTLISALIIQYGMGHEPCKLCIYERIPYIMSILLLVTILFFKKYKKNILFILSIIFLSSTILAFYHFGIEQSFFSESLVCEVNISENLSKKELLEQIKKDTISCKDVNFRILGLSLATINTIFSLGLSAIFTKLFIDYGKNK